MATVTKRMKAAKAAVDRSKAYAVDDALNTLKGVSKVKFVESVDVAVNLGVDPKKSDQVVRGAVVLPNGTGKSVRVAVFTAGNNAELAKNAGADIIGMDDLAAEIKGGRSDFDIVIATPDAMRVVGTLGQILGPRGLMPNPKSGTVTMEIGKAVAEVKAGKIDFKVDKTGIIHVGIGKTSFSPEQIADNARELAQVLQKLKPSSSKGTYFRSIYLSSTMGPGIKIDNTSVGV